MTVTWELELSLTNVLVPPVVHCKQYDNLSRKAVCRIFKGYEEVFLDDDSIVNVSGKRTDGEILEEGEKKRTAEADRREKTREKEQALLVRSVSAAIVLGTATAKAVERIPDTHCNGDMHAALEYADKVKREQDDFLTEQGIENIFEE